MSQCHTNTNYGGLQILSVVCYMLYQTDLVISFNMHALKLTKKSISRTAEGGGSRWLKYVSFSSNAYSDLYDINLKYFYYSQDQIDGFVTNLTKRMLLLLKKDGYF